MNRVREASRARIGLGGSKRKADISPKKVEVKKRSALGDVTNASKKKSTGLGGKDAAAKENKVVEKTKELKQEKPSMIPVLKEDASRVTRARSKSFKGNEEPLKPTEKTVAAPEPAKVLRENVAKPVSKITRRSKTSSTSKKNEKEESLPSVSPSEEESMYQTAVSSTPILKHLNNEDESSVEIENRKNDMKTESLKKRLPDGVNDFDEETVNDPFQVGLYAADIFAYYKRREARFPTRKYLDKQTELNKNMRSILVDWMVEVQESFEMNHETLYLAVKLVDLYLGKVIVKREKLQLVGTTALYIAAKYDERCPPVIDDFCYICDDAYSQKEVISMEEKLLRALKFDIGVPLSYRFLRRYARCAKLDMETLTLARYFLEMSLMDYDFIDEVDSKMAAATLLLALKVAKTADPWSATLQYYSGYTVEDLTDLTTRLHGYIGKPQTHLKTIRSKYSHKVFYEVAKLAMPDKLEL